MGVVTSAIRALAGHVGAGLHPVELRQYDEAKRTAVVRVHAGSIVLVHSALVLLGHHGGHACRFQVQAAAGTETGQ